MWRRGGRVVALERFPFREGRAGRGDRVVAQAARNADAVFIPDGPDTAQCGARA